MDSKIRLFTPSGQLITKLEGHSKGVISFSWHGGSDYHSFSLSSLTNFSSNSSLLNHSHQLLSGSWDGSACLWDLSTFTLLHRLSGHENGVNVLGLPTFQILTTSTGENVNGKPGNFFLRLWQGDKTIKKVSYHSDSIRSVNLLPGVTPSGKGGILTTSNDGTCILYDENLNFITTISNEQTLANSSTASSRASATMNHTALTNLTDGSNTSFLSSQSADSSNNKFLANHSSFILSSSVLFSKSGLDFFTCSENGYVSIYSGINLIQSIRHPSTVWCGLAIDSLRDFKQKEKRDSRHLSFLTGCQDGFIRSFTLFTKEEVEQQLIPSPIIGNDIELIETINELKNKYKENLKEKFQQSPSWSNRDSLARTSKEGTVSIFNFNDEKLIAAQLTNGQWEIIGDVMDEEGDGSGDGVTVDKSLQSGEVNGIHYDIVLPVEIEQSGGLVTLKLGYNRGENPYLASQRFIDTYQLSQTFLTQVANYIVQRTGASYDTPTTSGSTSSANNSNGIINKSALSISSYSYYLDLPNSDKLFQKFLEFFQDAQKTSPSLKEVDLDLLEKLIKFLSSKEIEGDALPSFVNKKSIIDFYIKIFTFLTIFKVETHFLLYDLLRLSFVNKSVSAFLSSTSSTSEKEELKEDLNQDDLSLTFQSNFVNNYLPLLLSNLELNSKNFLDGSSPSLQDISFKNLLTLLKLFTNFSYNEFFFYNFFFMEKNTYFYRLYQTLHNLLSSYFSNASSGIFANYTKLVPIILKFNANLIYFFSSATSANCQQEFIPFNPNLSFYYQTLINIHFGFFVAYLPHTLSPSFSLNTPSINILNEVARNLHLLLSLVSFQTLLRLGFNNDSVLACLKSLRSLNTYMDLQPQNFNDHYKSIVKEMIEKLSVCIN